MDNNDNIINMKIAEPELDGYAFYPELFVVPFDFCLKNWNKCDGTTILATKIPVISVRIS